MRDRGASYLLLGSLVLLAAFTANVVVGASGRGTLLSDIGELLVLFAGCTLFVAATLRLERKQKLQKQSGEIADAE